MLAFCVFNIAMYSLCCNWLVVFFCCPSNLGRCVWKRLVGVLAGLCLSGCVCSCWVPVVGFGLDLNVFMYYARTCFTGCGLVLCGVGLLEMFLPGGYHMGLNLHGSKLLWLLRIKKPSGNILNHKYLEQGVAQLHKMDAE